MENRNELARLEEFVDKLLTRYNTLKQDYLTLKATLEERDRECADLKNQVSELTSEQATVGSRVADLIGRIEQWENEQGADPGAEAGEDGGGDESAGVQATLFNRETETT